MKRIAFVALCALACVLAPSTGHASIGSGGFTKHHYGANGDPFGRDYYIYEPHHIASPRMLVVYLHGCSQTARDAAIGTRWDDVADRKGFVVAYPEQDAGNDPQDASQRSAEGSANGARCWNWFRPEDDARGAGEPQTIAGITRQVIARDRIDPRRVFVIGASAGANMATIMAVTYPELYAGVGSLVGCPYANCGDSSGEVAFRTMGPRARRMPAFVVDGEADELNPFVNSQAVVEEYLGVADLADDGQMNDSVSRRPTSVFNHGASGVGHPADSCVRPMEFPCLGGVVGFSGSYPYSVFTYRDHAGSIVQFFLIHGLGHDYPGGDPNGSFTDPLGPDITSAAYAFFAGHPRR